MAFFLPELFAPLMERQHAAIGVLERERALGVARDELAADRAASRGPDHRSPDISFEAAFDALGGPPPTLRGHGDRDRLADDELLHLHARRQHAGPQWF